MRQKIAFGVFALTMATLIGLSALLYVKANNELVAAQNTLAREIQVNDQILHSIQKQYNQTPPTAVEPGILL